MEKIILIRHQEEDASLYPDLINYYDSLSPHYGELAKAAVPLTSKGFLNSVGYVEYFKQTLKLNISALYATSFNAVIGVNEPNFPTSFTLRQYIAPWLTLVTLFNNLKYFSDPTIEQDSINIDFDCIPLGDIISLEHVSQLKKMFQEIKAKSGDVIVCWQHYALFWMAKTFGVVNQEVLALLKNWSSDEYNWIWVLNYQEGQLITIEHYLYDPEYVAEKILLRVFENVD